MRQLLSFLLLAASLFSQTNPAFEVASLKPDPHPAGRDARGRIAFEPARVSAHNVSLKDLIVAAYRIEPYQVFGGPGWLDSDEFDLDARASAPASREELARMLQTLLTERFHLSLRRENRDLRGYALTVDPRGARIRPVQEGDAAPKNTFRADMRQFARLLSVQLTIPAAMDPTRPAIASGGPVAVVDQTGLSGTYDFPVQPAPELGVDPFVLWQRVLQSQLGLKLEPRKVPAECLIVEHADRVPAGN